MGFYIKQIIKMIAQHVLQKACDKGACRVRG